MLGTPEPNGDNETLFYSPEMNANVLATDLAVRKRGSKSLRGGSTHLSDMKINRAETPGDYLNDSIQGVDINAQKFAIHAGSTDLITVQD